MKILHVITSLKTGGAEMLVVNLMPRFWALGYEVGVVVFNREHTTLMELMERECPQCKIYCLGTSYYNPWYIVKLMRIMWKFDVVHTHNSSPQLFAAIANVICRKKLITTEHNTNNRKRNHWLLAKIDRWMYTRYDKTICISDQAEENLRGYLNNDNQLSITRKVSICTIYNGVDVETIHQAESLEELKTTKFIVVMVAGFRPQKDQDTLVKAMALLPQDQYELWLVGTGVRVESLKFKVESLGLQDNVKFLGLRMDVPNILKTADVVVMSTHYEGLSLSNIEGMAAGKPFVASDVEGIREVTQGYGILFPHEDAEALAKIIQHLHDDPSYYKEIANNCYKRAKQFDISTMVSRYSDIYREIVLYR